MKRLIALMFILLTLMTACAYPVSTPTPTPTPTPTEAPTVEVISKGADGVGDPYYPQMGNGGYDVLHYTIDLSVDMESNTIIGTTTINAQEHRT